MAKYAGGEVLEGSAEYNDIKVEPAVVSITLDKINKSLEQILAAAEVKDIFTRLQFDVAVEDETYYGNGSNSSR